MTSITMIDDELPPILTLHAPYGRRSNTNDYGNDNDNDMAAAGTSDDKYVAPLGPNGKPIHPRMPRRVVVNDSIKLTKWERTMFDMGLPAGSNFVGFAPLIAAWSGTLRPSDGRDYDTNTFRGNRPHWRRYTSTRTTSTALSEPAPVPPRSSYSPTRRRQPILSASSQQSQQQTVTSSTMTLPPSAPTDHMVYHQRTVRPATADASIGRTVPPTPPPSVAPVTPRTIHGSTASRGRRISSPSIFSPLSTSLGSPSPSPVSSATSSSLTSPVPSPPSRVRSQSATPASRARRLSFMAAQQHREHAAHYNDPNNDEDEDDEAEEDEEIVVWSQEEFTIKESPIGVLRSSVKHGAAVWVPAASVPPQQPSHSVPHHHHQPPSSLPPSTIMNVAPSPSPRTTSSRRAHNFHRLADTNRPHTGTTPKSVTSSQRRLQPSKSNATIASSSPTAVTPTMTDAAFIDNAIAVALANPSAPHNNMTVSSSSQPPSSSPTSSRRRIVLDDPTGRARHSIVRRHIIFDE